MLKKRKNELYSEIITLFSPLFSETQLDAIIEVHRALTEVLITSLHLSIILHSISPKCYRYLKEVRNFPFIATLNKHPKSYKCEPGVLVEVLSLLRSKSDTLKEAKRITVLSFYEMSIAMEWSYDKGSDVLYKPYNNVQLVMLRGLISRWKQPIFYDFDESNLHIQITEYNK